MQGIVSKYSRRGRPVIERPGERSVVLSEYTTRPEIGASVEYELVGNGGNTLVGRLVNAKGDISINVHVAQHMQTPPAQIDTLCQQIRALWQREFVPYFPISSQESFVRDLQEIELMSIRNHSDDAARLAHENYQAFVAKSDLADDKPYGCHIFEMVRLFQGLEQAIRGLKSQ